jgi:hypothetical protein
LQPVVVVQVVVKIGSSAEPLFGHLPGGSVTDRIGVGVRVLPRILLALDNLPPSANTRPYSSLGSAINI